MTKRSTTKDQTHCRLIPLPTIKGRYPDAKEEKLLCALAQEGDDRARNFLISCNSPFIRFKTKHFVEKRGNCYSIEEMLGEATLGYIHAVMSFNPNKNARLNTHAGWWIYSYLSRWVSENRFIVHVPVYAQALDATLKPDIASAAERAMMPISPILGPANPNGKLQHTYGDRSLSREDEPPLEEQERFYPPLEDVMAILDNLPDPRHRIIGYRMLCEQTLDEVGEIVNLTRERVRQIEKKIFEHVRSKF